MSHGDGPLKSYEARTNRLLLALAGVFLVVYAADVLATGLAGTPRKALTATSWIIWGVFAADLALRTYLSGRPLRYLASHPLDVLMVALPALRPLRVLRIFTAGQTLLVRGGGLFRTTRAVVGAAGLLVVIAALAMLDAERSAPGSHITTLADALWWAATTVTTVGYGDTYPVTGTGRLVAVALMLVGISLVGLITATVAAWFVAQTRRQEQDELAISVRLARIELALEELRAERRSVG